MRRTGVFALALVALLLVGATYVFYTKYRKSAAEYVELTAQQDEMRQRYGQAINEIVTIQDSLNAIVLGPEGAGSPLSQHPAEVEGAGTLHDQVLARVSTLKAAIERTKERIEELDARLKKSGVKIQGLERMIAGLRKTVSQKEETIAQLNTQVDTLQTRVAGLSVEVEDTHRVLVDTQHEMATIFYTMGSKKQLIQSGVVVAQGGVLGLGKTVKPSGQFNESSFNTLDTDQENVIRIPAHKAQVVTPQPVTSYVIQSMGENMMELRILDPKEFRKVKHLVIMTA